MKKLNFKRDPMSAISKFIVEKRMLFYIIFAAAVVCCALLIPNVKINYDITSYLPPESETKLALDVMNREFEELGAARVMVMNVTYDQARQLSDRISEIDGIDTVTFDDTDSHYKNSCALISVSLDEPSGTDLSKAALAEMNALLDGYDVASTGAGANYANTLSQEMGVILAIAVAVIVVVLIFTSKSFMEIPVFLIVFVVAAILNMGTNALLGEISFVTNSIAVILQLALAIDYAIILSHRFMEERDTKPPKEAAIAAVSKAIPEIFSSSLTTVSGLVALMLMQLRIGADMGIVLAKGVIISCLTVFLLMPGLVMLFSKAIEKTRHRTFVPKITGFGKLVVKSRYVLSALFVCIVAAAGVLQSMNNYTYNYESREAEAARLQIETTFGKSNTLGVLVPKGDYEKERLIIDTFSEYDMINSATGLANISVGGVGLTDGLTPKEFSDFSGVELATVRNLYIIYGISRGDYTVIAGVDNYTATLIGLIDYAHTVADSGIVELDEETKKQLDEYYELLEKGKTLLEGETYSRIVFNIDGDPGGKVTFDLIAALRADLKAIDGEAYLLGDSVSAYDLSLSFSDDLTKINLLTAAFVLIILLFTFKSIGLPIMLILTIQGSIWINFAIPVITGAPLFFMSYLIISAIQMGATIDYAIVITNRYLAEKELTTDKKQAIINTLNGAFPTVFTSGSILTVAGFLVGGISTDPIISSIGAYLGQGTLISLIAVMAVLPQLLLITDKFISKTSLAAVKTVPKLQEAFDGKVSGRVTGYISGYVDAEMAGHVKGEVEAVIRDNLPEAEDGENPSAEKTDDTLSDCVIETDGKENIISPPTGDETQTAKKKRGAKTRKGGAK